MQLYLLSLIELSISPWDKASYSDICPSRVQCTFLACWETSGPKILYILGVLDCKLQVRNKNCWIRKGWTRRNGSTYEYCLSFQKPRLFLHMFSYKIFKILYFTFRNLSKTTRLSFLLFLPFFPWWINFSIMNAVHDTVTFSGVCPKLSFSPW